MKYLFMRWARWCCGDREK